MSKFVKVDDPSHLIPVVEERLPESCFILNQLKSSNKFKDNLEILTFGENKLESLWILTVFRRDDWGAWLSISSPPGKYGVPEEVKESLLSGEIFKWEEKFIFTAAPKHIVQLVVDSVLDVLGRIVTIYPCYLFRMTPEEALKLELSPPPGTELKRLSPKSGTAFIANNWKYTQDGTDTVVRKSIERLPSGGVFQKGGNNNNDNEDEDEPVCGAITPGFGLVSMLHTDPEHRRKGYASLAMRFIFKELAKEGLQPCLVTELENKDALNFHRSMGLTAVARMAFIGNGN